MQWAFVDFHLFSVISTAFINGKRPYTSFRGNAPSFILAHIVQSALPESSEMVT